MPRPFRFGCGRGSRWAVLRKISGVHGQSMVKKVILLDTPQSRTLGTGLKSSGKSAALDKVFTNEQDNLAYYLVNLLLVISCSHFHGCLPIFLWVNWWSYHDTDWGFEMNEMCTTYHNAWPCNLVSCNTPHRRIPTLVASTFTGESINLYYVFVWFVVFMIFYVLLFLVPC